MNYKKVPHEEVVPILIDASESIYTWNFVEVKVPHKKRKNVFNCQICGESLVSWNKSQVCIPCSNMNKNCDNK
jgi:formylmethanofuran dehydrogenase subunit E